MSVGFYVTAIDAGRVAWLAGPYDDHDDALAAVPKAREVCDEITEGRSHWWAFGTARREADALPQGRIMDRMGGAA